MTLAFIRVLILGAHFLLFVEIVIVKRLISFEKYFVKVCIPVYKLVMCSSPCFEGRESSLLGGCDPGDRTRQRMQLLCCWKVGLA
jgi:hypothetical protein